VISEIDVDSSPAVETSEEISSTLVVASPTVLVASLSLHEVIASVASEAIDIKTNIFLFFISNISFPLKIIM